MGKYPATNANYSAYLKATGYTPRDPYHWLRQWGGAAEPPAALRDTPVTYLSLAEVFGFGVRVGVGEGVRVGWGRHRPPLSLASWSFEARLLRVRVRVRARVTV